MNILIVRLGALGRHRPRRAGRRGAARAPSRRADRLAGRRPASRRLLDLVTGLDRVVPLERPLGERVGRTWSARLRQVAYDVALDFQGLMKSAVLARASGARRVSSASRSGTCGRRARARSIPRRTTARPKPRRRTSSTRTCSLLAVARRQHRRDVEFPLADVVRRALDAVQRRRDGEPFALINPGAAWPNKRWPPERFGEVARVPPRCPRAAIARAVGAGRSGARRRGRRRRRRARPASRRPRRIRRHRSRWRAPHRSVVSGDTGPLHIAGAVGTPIVGDLRTDRSRAQRTLGGGRCGRVAVRRLSTATTSGSAMPRRGASTT